MVKRSTPVRLPEDLAQQVDVVARGRGIGFNALIVESLEAELDRVRTDETFMAHLRSLAERDKEILDLLAE